MSLKLNQRVIPHFSCRDWVYSAIGSKRYAGKHGFWGYSSQDWQYWTGYKKINNKHPELSPPEAADEMSYYMETLRQDITRNAELIDAQLRRLTKMEQELTEVLKAAKEGAQ